MTEGRFSGKVTIVTGAASGIGAAIATRFAAEGANVVIADLRQEAADAAAAKLTGAIGVACDVGDEAAVEACCKAAMDKWGRIDTIVNNAGMMLFKTLAEWTADDWLRILHVDLLGAAFFTKQAFLHMGEAGGSLVNIASVHAQATTANIAPYSAAKAALLSMTRTTPVEGRDRHIRANASLPGAVDTPMLCENPNLKSGAEPLDKKDVGKPEDIAAVAAFLASDDARFVTGVALPADGGRLAKL